MSSYIGKVQIGTNTSNRLAIGSTLYGVCNTAASTAAKTATLPEFDAVMHGVTIHIKFIYGNTATNNLSLQIGSLPVITIAGNCICEEGDVITFTLDETGSDGSISSNNSDWRWRANNSQSFVTREEISDLLGNADAMIFKGTIGTGGTTTIPNSGYSAGWTYRVITAGTYVGQECDEGDLLIAIHDADNSSPNNNHWAVAQGNLEGAVTGPSSSGDTHVAIFDGTHGDIIKDSGYTIGTSVPGDAVFTDHEYELVTNANAYVGSAPDDSEGTVLVEVENGVLQLSPYIKFTTAAVGTALAAPSNSNNP